MSSSNPKDEKKIDYLKNIEEAEKALIKNPKDTSALFKKGRNLCSLKRYEEAIACYDKAIELNPKNMGAYNNKGNVLSEMKRYWEAIACYGHAIKLDPKQPVPYNNKGGALYHLKRYKVAIACYDKAIELNPKYAAPHSGRGNALSSLKRYKEAIACYDNAIELDSMGPRAHNNKGNALYNLNRYEESIKCYNKAIELAPKAALPYANKGSALSKLKHYDEAVTCYDKAIELDPNYALPRELRARLIRERNLWDHDSDFLALAGNKYKTEELFRKLWGAQDALLQLLRVQFQDGKDDDAFNQVAHYTTTEAFEFMIGRNEKQDNKLSELSLGSVTNANDPSEGKVFEKFLGYKQLGSDSENMIVLQSSFSKRINHLTQFRLYGKKDRKEGSGVCLVFDKNFFDTETTSHPIMIATSSTGSVDANKEMVSAKESRADETYKRPLYWVLYYDSEKNAFYYTNAQCSLEISPTILNKDKKMGVDSIKSRQRINARIAKALYDVRKIYESICNSGEQVEEKKQAARRLLIYLRHLVKDVAFSDEQEMRILTLHHYGDKSVFSRGNQLVMNYRFILNEEKSLKEVIGGPKIEGFRQQAEIWRQHIKQLSPLHLDIPFRQSKAPLA